jgi:hypothetical protein
MLLLKPLLLFASLLLFLIVRDAPGTSGVGDVPSIAYCCWPLLLLVLMLLVQPAVAEVLSIAYCDYRHPIDCFLLLASLLLFTSLLLLPSLLLLLVHDAPALQICDWTAGAAGGGGGGDSLVPFCYYRWQCSLTKK